MQIIDILIIDDNKEYCRSLKNRFKLLGEDLGLTIRLKDFQNLEDGYEELEGNIAYKALILDAKAHIRRDQEKDEYDFLPVALSKLAELNRKTGRDYIPFAVNTGYYHEQERFNTLLQEMRGRLFDKSIQEEELLQYLLDGIQAAENTVIEVKFKEVFEIFELNYLPSTERLKLLNILKKIDQEANIKDNFNPLRKFLEVVYTKIKETKPELLPSSVFERSPGHINLEWTWRYLSGLEVTTPNGSYRSVSPVFPKHIAIAVKTFLDLSQKISHQYGNKITPFIYNSAAYALLETLIWFKEFMKTCNNQK